MSAVARLPIGAKEAVTGTEAKMKRIGCTTVCWASQFAATRAKFPRPQLPDSELPPYDLLEMPAMMADRLGVHNVELLSMHFTELTPAYCEKVRATAAKVKSNVINIQLDAPGQYDLSAPDPEARRRSIDFVQGWLDRAHICGATSLRPNTGPFTRQAARESPPPFSLDVTGDSFRRLAEHGDKIGVKVLVENHGGYSDKIENILAIAKYAGRNCATLPDLGNFSDQTSEEDRLERLRILFRNAHLCSAKGMYFDEQNRHISYDFRKCIRIGEQTGFKGIYSAEFWARKPQAINPWTAVRVIIDMTLESI